MRTLFQMPDIMVLLAHGEENQPTMDYGMPVSTDMVYSKTPAIKCGEPLPKSSLVPSPSLPTLKA